MTKDQVIEHYELVCEINELEELIKAMNYAESVEIKLCNRSMEYRKERSLLSDEIIDIRNIFQNKLDKLNKELEEL